MLVLPTRSRRRAKSRDEARKHPHHPKLRQHGRVAEIVHGRTRLPEARIGATSGRRRIDAKRNARGEFWRTVRIQVSAEIEPYFRQHLALLDEGARIVSARPSRCAPTWDMDVHIPGAPANAVTAEPVLVSVRHDGYWQPRVEYVDYRDAAGQRIEVAA
jgi:hypothetical protein